ncbi:MAG: 50S ribosomal protein L2 [Candidatus Aenigmatarchaeota archaeon]|nr:MAG: 50S ribosomal protein L2 [Candidatus Aenigmarchaeota archaeon]
MGKRIIVRRRGKGSSTYRAKGKLELKLPKKEGKAKVVDIQHISARNTPIAKIRFEDGTISFIAAPIGLSTEQTIDISPNAEVSTGNILPLSKIPEGYPVYFIESVYKDGGKFCRSSGSFAIVKSHEKDYAFLEFPSKKIKKLKGNCRAIVGKPAGFARNTKPFLKAGTKWKVMKSKGKLYPRTSGSKMNPVDHPFGGKTKPGKSTSVSKNAPPGQKVGSIAPRRTGKKKK